MSKILCIGALVAASGAASASNDILVQIHGSVFDNRANVSDLSAVSAGESVTYSFELDSTMFADSGVFPIRGYTIDTSTFSIDFSGGVSVGIADPYPAGATPMFVVRNDDPAVDGFYLGESIGGLPSPINTDQAGILGDFEASFSVTYDTDPISSLDILGAMGSYDFAGLTVFGMGINDGFVEGVVGIDFTGMTIGIIPAPGTAGIFVSAALLATRRRR